MSLIDLTTKTFESKQDPTEQFGLDVLMGLSSKPKSLPPKYFYDDLGSRYFQEICETEEYYPTKCEAEIFETKKQDIVDQFSSESITMVELGAGDGRKTKILLDEISKRKIKTKYFPIDISSSALEGLIAGLQTGFPNIEAKGIVAEYFTALKWLSFESKEKKVVLMLGGNIGNFSTPEQRVFLKTLWNSLNDGDIVLTGFDLKKDIDVMLSAYNDKSGATKRFNLNLLTRMNRELGANFDISKFSHFGTYNVALGAMESFLISLEEQEVEIPALDTKFRFKPFEAIHNEYSFKFLPSEINQLVTQTGFEVVHHYTDSRNYFLDALLRVKKNIAF